MTTALTQPYASVGADEIEHLRFSSDGPWVVVLHDDPFIREAWMSYGDAYHVPIICFASHGECLKALEFIAPGTIFVIESKIGAEAKRDGCALNLVGILAERGFPRAYLYGEDGCRKAAEMDVRYKQVTGVLTLGEPIESLLCVLNPEYREQASTDDDACPGPTLAHEGHKSCI